MNDHVSPRWYAAELLEQAESMSQFSRFTGERTTPTLWQRITYHLWRKHVNALRDFWRDRICGCDC